MSGDAFSIQLIGLIIVCVMLFRFEMVLAHALARKFPTYRLLIN